MARFQLYAYSALCALFISVSSPECQAADEVSELIARVRAVGAQGKGSAEARAAVAALSRRGPEIIPALLQGMDTPDTVAANWLRVVLDGIVARARESAPSSIPAADLRRVVLDPARHGRVRRLALDVLTQVEPDAPGRIVPLLLDDPEFRRDAVAAAIARGDRAAADGRAEAAIEIYSRAFGSARDADQLRALSAKLRSHGREPSIREHLGFVVDWYLIGPFHGPEFTAFTKRYPPETERDLAAAYDGQTGRVAWKRYRTPDEFGTVDLVKAIGHADDAAAYAFTTVESDVARKVQIRCGADDNLAIWVNGHPVFAKEEWQNGTRLDRFIVPVELRKGTNELLVKVCQGPKYRDPEMGNLWSMQLRICDTDGKGIVLPVLLGREGIEP